MRREILLISLLLSGAAAAQEGAVEEPAPPETGPPAGEQPAAESAPGAQAAAEESGGVKTLSGMSVLGNEEAPKSLVIVPWKSSQLGDGLGVSNSTDDRALPVDKEVFMREVHYHELRAGGGEPGS